MNWSASAVFLSHQQRSISNLPTLKMSMYSQSSYPSTSYDQYSGFSSSNSAAPPPNRYFGGYSSSPPTTTAPYQPPPPSSQDVQIFRSWFTNQLSTLVENNRAVIHRLAYIAREHIHRFAPIISQCLEAHIRRVSNSIHYIYYTQSASHRVAVVHVI